MYSMEEMLSDRLIGFLPQRSTHHCLVELYTRLSHNSVVVFIDLKIAFDVANKHVILDQLVDFRIKGRFLKWIRILVIENRECIINGFVTPSKILNSELHKGGGC